jgi:MFS family permease
MHCSRSTKRLPPERYSPMILSRTNQQRALVALVQVLGLSVWFSATAVAPSLRSEWGIGSTGAVWLTASVQIGFVAGAVASAVLNLADRTRPQHLLAASALCAATCTAALAMFVNGLWAAIPLRFCTGMFLAGVYPVGMKLMASWSQSAARGRTFGVLLAGLTLGSALPHLISGLGPLPWRMVMLAAAALTAAAAVLALTSVRAGPHLDIRAGTPNPRHALAALAQRGPRLTSLGYFGHMWELYALWTWLSMFVATGRAQRGEAAASSAGVIAFVAIGVAGTIGCLVGGWASDRYGRSPTAVTALAISGACCAASPVFFAAPTVVLIAFLLVWGAAVIADSGVFSTSLSETADPRFIGTALTAQTAIGFLLTVVTIQLVPIVADRFGWQYAFLLLAPGPLLGAVAMSALGARREHPHPEEESHDQPNAHTTVRRSDRAALTHGH